MIDRIKLREARRSKKITSQKFAETLGVHRTYISQIESGVRTPGQALIQRMAKVLGVDTSEICLDEPGASTDRIMEMLNERYAQMTDAEKAELLTDALRIIERRTRPRDGE
jgi:transcriptional regulator with XRE-family HTH domain